MKGTSQALEMKAIKTITNGDPKFSRYLLNSLTSDHFSYESTRGIWEFLKKLHQKDRSIPSAKILAESVNLSGKQKILLKGEFNPVTRGSGVKAMVQELDRSRQYRMYAKTVQDGQSLLQEDSQVDIEELIIAQIGRLQKIQSLTKHDIFSAGKNGNELDKSANRIFSDIPVDFIPTGFNTFDGRNGGLLRGGLVTIAANTGGGKSVVTLQIANNAYKKGYSVCYVSLELSPDEQVARIVSQESGVEFRKIMQKSWTPKEKATANQAWEKFKDSGVQQKSSFSYWNPAGLSASQIVGVLEQHSYDLVVIDMINLLSPESKGYNETEAAIIGNSSRIFKTFAQRNDCVVIQLAQMNDEGKVKYARKLVEDSDLLLQWECGDAEKEAHAFQIVIGKARNQECFSFPLIENFAIMRAENPVDDSQVKLPDKAKRAGGKKKPQDLDANDV